MRFRCTPTKYNDPWGIERWDEATQRWVYALRKSYRGGSHAATLLWDLLKQLYPRGRR